MMYSVAARPVMIGSIMSRVRTSGLSRSHRAIAVLPSSASPTTSRSGSLERISIKRLRIVSESSTTRTRILAITLSPHELAEGSEDEGLVELPFDDVGVRAGGVASLAVLGRRPRRDEDARHLAENRVRAHLRHELEPVHSGHLHVDEAHPVTARLRLDEPLLR